MTWLEFALINRPNVTLYFSVISLPGDRPYDQGFNGSRTV